MPARIHMSKKELIDLIDARKAAGTDTSQLENFMAELPSEKAARIISKLLHPYLCLPVVLAMIAFGVSSDLGVTIKWTLAALLPAYTFPLLYLYGQAKVVAVARASRIQTLYTAPRFLRENPNEMSIVACLFGIFSVPLLYLLGSPSAVTATMVSVTVTMLLITQVNRIYRASFHLAFFTSMVVSLGIILELPWLFIAPFIVLLGLSRYQLSQHTPAQLVVALLIALVVTVPILNAFGVS